MKNQGAITALALATLALGGCTGSQAPPATTASTSTATLAEPRVTSSPTPTPSQTASPAPDVSVAPDPPGALDGPPTTDNAVAVAKYFISLFPYAFATGDTESWRQLSGESCRYCADILDAVESDQEAGRHSVGGHVEHTFGSAMDFEDGTFFVTLRYVEHPSVSVDSSGAVVEKFPDTDTVSAEVSLEWRENHWVVQGVKPTVVEST